jgi:hypothetical protein
MAQVTKVRLPDGRVLTPGDWTSAEPLYSTIEIAAGPYTTLQAFSYALGGDVPGSNVGLGSPRKSNLADTNLLGQGAQLPENEELIVYAMEVEAFTLLNTGGTDDGINPPALPHVSVLNMLRLQRDLVLVMKIASVKEYTRAPLAWFPASTGVTPTYSQAQTAIGPVPNLQGFVTGNNGSTDVGGKRVFASPLYVDGGEALVIDFLAPKGEVEDLSLGETGRIRLRTFLDGYRKRPVA